MRFFYRTGRPVARINVISGGFVAQQIERDTRKLAASTAVTEQNFVVRGNVQQIAKILFCLFRHLNKGFTPVADFHHRRTQTVPVTQLLLSLFEHICR